VGEVTPPPYHKEAIMATETTKKVKIKLPLTRTEKDDVYVAVNGKSYLIKRGETVEVPASVAEVLQHKEEMLAQAMEFENQASANVE
jgi:hypothetical protein